MPPDFQHLLNDATRLTRQGKLQAATAAIQSALQGANSFRPNNAVPEHSQFRRDQLLKLSAPEPANVAKAAMPGSITERFISCSHGSAAMNRGDYKLYIPPGAGARPLPLVLMLHGCTQNPDDFAAGTAMNTLAGEQGFYVLYPAQSAKANPQRCWNWFKHNHQSRGHGEPALLVEITQTVLRQHLIDGDRVYVAGLSAGGAMAAILGDTYPEIFAAVGVHSGLAAGIANDLSSALSAMKGVAVPAQSQANGVPTIVFHGDADSTVHSSNGARIIAACVGSVAPAEVKQISASGKRTATRSLYRDANGAVLAEHWLLHGAAHNWSGGSALGTYTDTRGPDASAEMLRFFLQHPRRAAI